MTLDCRRASGSCTARTRPFRRCGSCAPAPSRWCSTASTSATCGSAVPSSFAASTRRCATSTGTRFRGSSRAWRSRRGRRVPRRVRRPPRTPRDRLQPGTARSRGTRTVGSSTSSTGARRRDPATAASVSASTTRGGRPPAPRSRARTPDGELEGAFPDLIGPPGDLDGAYRALFPAFDRLEVELRRRQAAPRVRGRPVGDRGPSQLDRRELQDVLDADRLGPPAPLEAGQALRQRLVIAPVDVPRGRRPAMCGWTSALRRKPWFRRSGWARIATCISPIRASAMLRALASTCARRGASRHGEWSTA